MQTSARCFVLSGQAQCNSVTLKMFEIMKNRLFYRLTEVKYRDNSLKTLFYIAGKDLSVSDFRV